ncbi:unnamed protein product [Rotaria magnacalcarata]|uniref:DUF218 domain-containing protein n=1 Tax=Rotaria magnacalcarata TaxID=392030 RepID=A0A815YGM1_9BILA|nr:unnamed protein product [Rotaria magnacalcarata]CAF4099697.1 unnamed protein product [Rotaria magnacalcarata]
MTYDCIVLPGGGVGLNGSPSAWVFLSCGTTHHLPVLNKNSFPINEATVSAAYLIERNIPSNKILIENWSLDTIGNTYFARQCIIEPMELHPLAVITNDFHMARTKLIFDWIFSLSTSAIDRSENIPLNILRLAIRI